MTRALTIEHTGRILVVDDSITNIQMLTDMLEQRGYEVCSASDGMLAMRIARENPPDIILLDIVMPNMDGFKVCQFLKGYEGTRDIPVVFMTSLAETRDKVKGFKMGAADYITKPFQTEEVLARVETLLSLHAMRKKLEEQNRELRHTNVEMAGVNRALHHEIVENRQVTEALRTTLVRLTELEAIVNRSPAIAFLWGAAETWPVHYVSDNIAQIGYSPEDLLSGRVPFHDLIHPQDRQRILDGFSRYRQDGIDDFSQQYRIITRWGEVRWVDGRTWVRRAEGGAVTHYQGIMIDITKRKQFEEALQESEERLRTLINAMPDIVAFKDGEGRWLEANNFDLRLFRLDQVAYRGKKDAELAEFSPFYRDAFLACEQSDEEAWQSGTLGRGDEIIPRPDGPPMVFDIIKVPMFHSDGRRKGLVVVGRDITERKLAEAALKQHQEQLEELVRARTEELAEANSHLKAEISERRRAEEQVRASLKEKEMLLKEIHHRVKNNLQIVSSLLELQSGSISDHHSQKALQESQDRIKSMALLHEKLYKTADFISIDFGDYISNLTSSLFNSYVVDPDSISLVAEVEAVPLGVDEAIPLGLIVNELVSNSLKYAFPLNRCGEINVKLRFDTDGEIVLEVSDDGIGLPPDLDFRNTETLGLQLVTMLVKQIRGTIDLEKEHGTTFRISFRACRGQEMRDDT